MSMSDFKPAQCQVELTTGESVRIIRELQGLSQEQLAALTGISQPNISAIENNRVPVSIRYATTLARALNCHPAVLAFPGWEIPLAA